MVEDLRAVGDGVVNHHLEGDYLGEPRHRQGTLHQAPHQLWAVAINEGADATVALHRGRHECRIGGQQVGYHDVFEREPASVCGLQCVDEFPTGDDFRREQLLVDLDRCITVDNHHADRLVEVAGSGEDRTTAAVHVDDALTCRAVVELLDEVINAIGEQRRGQVDGDRLASIEIKRKIFEVGRVVETRDPDRVRLARRWLAVQLLLDDRVLLTDVAVDIGRRDLDAVELQRERRDRAGNVDSCASQNFQSAAVPGDHQVGGLGVLDRIPVDVFSRDVGTDRPQVELRITVDGHGDIECLAIGHDRNDYDAIGEAGQHIVGLQSGSHWSDVGRRGVARVGDRERDCLGT